MKRGLGVPIWHLLSSARVTRRWLLSLVPRPSVQYIREYGNETNGYIYTKGKKMTGLINEALKVLEIISYYCYLEQILILCCIFFPRITRVGDIEVPQIRPARCIGPEKVITTFIFLRQFLQ